MTEKVGGVEFEVKTDASGVVDGSKKIVNANKSVEDSFQEVDDAAKKSNETLENSGKGAEKAGKKVKGMRGNLGMAGVQFSQFTQQVAGGQNALLAFAQQSQDLAFFFGPAGALALSIGSIITLVGVGLVDAFNSAESASKQLPEKLQKRLDDIRTRLEGVSESTKSAFFGVEFGKLNQEYDLLSQKIKQVEESVLRQSQALNSTGQEGLTAARKISAFREEQEELLKLINSVSDLSTGGIGTGTDEAYLEQEKSVADSYTRRIDALSSALQVEREMISSHSQTVIAIKKGEITATEAAEINADIAAQGRITARFDTLVANLEMQRESILENEKLTGEERLSLKAELDQLELEAEMNKDGLLEKQAKEQSDRMVAIKKAEEQAKRNILTGALGDISSLMNTHSRKAFEIGKAAAISSSVVTGIDAAIKAWDAGMSTGGPWAPAVAAAYAGASLLKTGAQIQQIKSQSFGAGGAQNAGAFSGGLPAVNTQQTQQGGNQTISLAGINADSLISGGQLVETLNQALGDGYTINFAGGT